MELSEMDSLTRPYSAATADLQTFILSKLKGRSRLSHIVVNAIVNEIGVKLPSCALSSGRLAEIVSEAAMLVGLVPVVDLLPMSEYGEFTGSRR
jgi:hypothetical protein